MEKIKKSKVFGGNIIRSDGVVISRLGKKLKHQLSNNGYIRVELHNNGVSKKFLIHRLLAQAFIDNPNKKEIVNHIDGNKCNNNLDNLEWCTRSENQLHSYRCGLQKGYKKPTPLSPTHKAALCGSRWRNEKRIYHAEGIEFNCPKKAASHFHCSRQTFYNRANSERFPLWNIEIRQEVK